MWDVQTGGLTHTFTARSEINDIAVSRTGDHIACGSSDGSITFWSTHTKEEGEGFGNGQPVVAIFWLSPCQLVVATQGTVYTHDIDDGETLVLLLHPWSRVGNGPFVIRWGIF
jgi:WD40 repeat protein